MKKIFYLIFVTLWSTIVFAQKITAEYEPNSGKYGIKKGEKWMLPPKYGFASWDDASKLGMVCRDSYNSEKQAIVNQYGKIITDYEYSGAETRYFDGIESMSNLIITYKTEGLWGVIDYNGNVIVPCIYSLVLPEWNKTKNQSWFLVKSSDGKFGLLHSDGSGWIDTKYTNYLTFNPSNPYMFVNVGGKVEGAYTIGGKWGAIDIDGKEIVPCVYDNVVEGGWLMRESTDSLLFAVNKGGDRDKLGNTVGGKWGLYLNGKEVVACKYDEAPRFWFDDEAIEIRNSGKVETLRNPLAKVKSDVDENIPIVKENAPTLFAVIIGNEKYEDETDVPYAECDANVFKDYCQKTLGLQENHIRFISNAGYNDLRRALGWLKQGLEAYGGEGCAIFYYAGHGIPDENEKTAYLLPVDGSGSDVESAYSLDKLYQTLGSMQAKNILVFLDACFSGAKRDGKMMASARGVAIKTKVQVPQTNTIVFTAAQGGETAYPYKEQQHGMFTYFLLRKIQETKGNVSLGTLADYIVREVKRQSFDSNNRSQTPAILVSPELIGLWRDIKLK